MESSSGIMLNKFALLFLSYFTFTCYSWTAEVPSSNKNHLLFLMSSGHISQAIDVYKQYHQQNGQHDFELIQEMGLFLLDQGYHSSDPETQIMTIFGAGISMNERTLYILEAGMDSNLPELQLMTLITLRNFKMIKPTKHCKGL